MTSVLHPPTPARAGSVRQAAAVVVPPLLLVGGMGVATHSVVRYKFWIVVVYTVLAVLLAFWVARPAVVPELTTRSAGAPRPSKRLLAGVMATTLLLAAVLDVKVRPYTYLTKSQGWTVRIVFAVTSLLVAAAVLLSVRTGRVTGRRLLEVGFGLAVVGYLVAATLLIHWDPRPKIDVWVMLQQAADGLLHGKNMYTQTWHGSPGVQNAFTYLPFMGLLLAPGKWFFGDVRWMLVILTLLGALAVRLLARDDATQVPAAAPDRADDADAAHGNTLLVAVSAAALLLLLPGTATQVEQAWTEPLLMASLAGWALGVQRRKTWLAVFCFALGLASKQHFVLLLPILAAWPRFGWRRTLSTAVLAGVFVLPWFLASPKDMIHDAVTVLINFQPLIFADTLFIAAIKQLHWTPPFWLTGLAILAPFAGGIVLVRRRNPDLATVLRWCALLLFVANLVNKQAFYNQYWLIAAMVVISFAVAPGAPALDGETDAEAPSGSTTEPGPDLDAESQPDASEPVSRQTPRPAAAEA